MMLHPLGRSAKMSKKEEQELWTSIMRDESKDMSLRLKSSELLAISRGDFVEPGITSDTVKTNVPSLIKC